MRPQQILEIVDRDFPLTERGPHHYQILIRKGVFHDLWIADKGRCIKARLHSQPTTTLYFDADCLLHDLRNFALSDDPSPGQGEEAATMQELSRRVSQTIDRATSPPSAYSPATARVPIPAAEPARVNQPRPVVVQQFTMECD